MLIADCYMKRAKGMFGSIWISCKHTAFKMKNYRIKVSQSCVPDFGEMFFDNSSIRLQGISQCQVWLPKGNQWVNGSCLMVKLWFPREEDWPIATAPSLSYLIHRCRWPIPLKISITIRCPVEIHEYPSIWCGFNWFNHWKWIILLIQWGSYY